VNRLILGLRSVRVFDPLAVQPAFVTLLRYGSGSTRSWFVLVAFYALRSGDGTAFSWLLRSFMFIRRFTASFTLRTYDVLGPVALRLPRLRLIVCAFCYVHRVIARCCVAIPTTTFCLAAAVPLDRSVTARTPPLLVSRAATFMGWFMDGFRAFTRYH